MAKIHLPPPSRARPALRLRDLSRGFQLRLSHHVDLELARRHRVAKREGGVVEVSRAERNAVTEPQPQHAALARRES